MLHTKQPQGSAFVTFSYERHAKAALKDLGRPLLTQLALCCKTGRGAPPRFKGRSLSVRRAPEPSDVQWDNTSSRGLDKYFRHFAAYTLTLLVLGAGGVMQWGFNRAKENQRVTLLQLEVAGKASASSSDAYRLRGLSAANGLAIVLINSIVQYILPKLNDFERFHTYRRAGRGEGKHNTGNSMGTQATSPSHTGIDSVQITIQSSPAATWSACTSTS